MDAQPILYTLARVLSEQNFEAILIGNAAAALRGAPVTTIDFDFLFRKTPRNIQKLKAVATALDAVILRPFYPTSGLYRVSRDEDSLQLDFMTTIDGVSSFGSLRAKAEKVDFGGHPLLVASLAAVLASKKAAGRPQDQRLRRATEKRAEALAALKLETEIALDDQIDRLLAKPMNQRTHFLRKRIGYTASCL